MSGVASPKVIQNTKCVFCEKELGDSLYLTPIIFPEKNAVLKAHSICASTAIVRGVVEEV